ncbi:DinB family protein [Paenibacillus hemerocallicola]|uniref:DinB family protein n=1 Tax=Paenibacillus hemerocallicola TaxID=1172614 RepID=A0A5C4TD66_9BACL|nr:DinB family protein [Paenibacillus hemerocallicola]TNJ67014.1 DinB family protein [Paenibacillus hemerocallicola]
MSPSCINTSMSVRQIVLHQLQSIPEPLFDVQPQAFGNTIRWNVGHIVFYMDYYLSLDSSYQSNLPETYARLFNTGTKPSDWIVSPPTKEELVQLLSGQLDRLSDVSPNTLEAPLASPIEMGPFRFETFGDAFHFAFIHEAIHLGTISSLFKVVR